MDLAERSATGTGTGFPEDAPPAHGGELAKRDSKRLRDRALRRPSICFDAISFSDLHKVMAVQVFMPKNYKTNLSSPELAEQLYRKLVGYKHRTLKRAYWALLARFVPLVVAVVYYRLRSDRFFAHKIPHESRQCNPGSASFKIPHAWAGGLAVALAGHASSGYSRALSHYSHPGKFSLTIARTSSSQATRCSGVLVTTTP
ncbi:MAG: hypothetical protein PHY05_01600 [Methanothrix sp.]|nr:hypothetical protein [Methanothrix sp.]